MKRLADAVFFALIHMIRVIRLIRVIRGQMFDRFLESPAGAS